MGVLSLLLKKLAENRDEWKNIKTGTLVYACAKMICDPKKEKAYKNLRKKEIERLREIINSLPYKSFSYLMEYDLPVHLKHEKIGES
jgi:hypothetical protein